MNALLKETSAKQERYIAELEKQLSLLQKTLDLIAQRQNIPERYAKLLEENENI